MQYLEMWATLVLCRASSSTESHGMGSVSLTTVGFEASREAAKGLLNLLVISIEASGLGLLPCGHPFPVGYMYTPPRKGLPRQGHPQYEPINNHGQGIKQVWIGSSGNLGWKQWISGIKLISPSNIIWNNAKWKVWWPFTGDARENTIRLSLQGCLCLKVWFRVSSHDTTNLDWMCAWFPPFPSPPPLFLHAPAPWQVSLPLRILMKSPEWRTSLHMKLLITLHNGECQLDNVLIV